MKSNIKEENPQNYGISATYVKSWLLIFAVCYDFYMPVT